MTLNGLDKDVLVLFDVNGHSHEIRIAQIQNTLAIGWSFYVVGFLLNIAFYKVSFKKKEGGDIIRKSNSSFRSIRRLWT